MRIGGGIKTRRNFLKEIVYSLSGILFSTFVINRFFFPKRFLFLKVSEAKETPVSKALRPVLKNGLNRALSIGEAFSGEELGYSISFLWFKKAASGRIVFKKETDKRFMVSVEAETLGFIGWITRYRKDNYNVYMEEIADGRRLRTYRFEKIVKIGKKVRRGYINCDYNKRVMEWKSWGGGKPERGEKEDIPPGLIYDDPISAFYNFRYGAYGILKKGKEFFVTTFPKDKKPSKIYLRIAGEKEEKERLRGENDINVMYLVDIKINGDLIDSKTGRIEVHMDKDLLPVKGIVKDLFFFGDITGRLVEKI